ncbi:hypothetical protein [Flavobacterium sp. H122]|uniref:hypothetical protein n=1 Tax=Flavobacterium sp. H122 TaxID=2529860 RepID=UPI0010AB49A9|nr:hypothetical protein [Flavobacterium sp. H122]
MKNLFLSALFMLSNFLFSQKQNENKIPKGSYSQGSTSGIYIFEDNTFALYGYATLVFGEYKIQNNSIDFIPFKPEQPFTILGRENKSVKKGIKLTFESSFIEYDSIFVKFDKKNPINLLESNIEKGKPYYITNLDYKPSLITLIQNKENSENNNDSNTYSFNINPNYNDFLLFYNVSKRESEPFSGKIMSKNKQTVLVCDWGNFKKENKEEAEMLTFLNQYKKEYQKSKTQNEFHFNDRLKKATGYNHLSERENIFSIDNYILDASSNKYIRKDIYKKQKKYLNEKVTDYHDESIILKYDKINPSLKNFTDLNKITKGKNEFLFKSYKDENKDKKKEEIKSEKIYLSKPLEQD